MRSQLYPCSLPIVKESECGADGDVVDAERNGVALLQGMNRHLLAHYGHVWSPEMKQCSDGCNAGCVNQVSVMIQKVNIDTDRPDL